MAFGQTHQVDVYYLLMIDTYDLGVYETSLKKIKRKEIFRKYKIKRRYNIIYDFS